MAIYRGMDIGTAKPSAREQTRIPHHLIDVADPHEEFSTARYLTAAEQAVREILSRSHIPVFVGGTGLYLRSVLRGVFEGPSADWAYRQQLETRAAEHGPQCLHQQLALVDPPTAHRLHPNDQRRVIRALEIHHLTGQPASSLHDESPLPEAERPRHVYWLAPPREWLYERINQRVAAMLSSGWIEEVDKLLNLAPPMGRSARQALGYQELITWREGGPGTLAEIENLIATRTRQFAKRQQTWFRNLIECQSVSLPNPRLLRELLERQ